MNFRVKAFIGLAMSVVFASAAKADSFTYDLESSDNSVMLLSLTFTTAGSCSGTGQVCEIAGISGTLTDSNFLSAPESITSFAPDNGTPPGPYLTGDFLFLYDNLINPDGTGAGFDGSVLDGIGGVVFYVGGETPLEVGLSGGGDNTYFLNESPDGINNNYVTNEELVGTSATAVAEPSPLLLMGSGLLIVALASRKLATGRKAARANS
jgi:hypothetical protein